MNLTRILLRAAVGGAALATVALPAAAVTASAKTPSTAMYSVTFRAQMTDDWQSREHYTDDCNLTGDLCKRDETGEGAAKLTVSTRRPTRFMVMRGVRGRPPTIGVGTGEGAAIAGPYLRTGRLDVVYSGPWDAGNPDRSAPAEGCGTRTVRGDVNFTWRGRNQLGLSPILDEDREGCPTGPSQTWEWADDESPSLGEVVAQVGQSKFLRTRQFTVRGSKTFTGVIPPFSRADDQGSFLEDGTRTVTWQWEATFRMERAKKRKRR